MESSSALSWFASSLGLPSGLYFGVVDWRKLRAASGSVSARIRMTSVRSCATEESCAIAGTEAANASFGIQLALLREGRERVLASHRERPVDWVGKQVMYFETGQGSALSAGAHHGVDQQTLEARAYGIARAFAPLLVNSVVGFIG